MRKERILKSILILAVIGFVIASYSLYEHYQKTKGLCDFSAKFSCDIVNRSAYAEVYGIPVALLGMLGYGILFVVAWLLKKEESKDFRKILFMLSLLGVLFSAYLTYIEAFVLLVFCPVCLLSALVMVLVFVQTMVLARHARA